MKLPPINYTFHKNYENCPRKAWHINIAKDLPKSEDSQAMRWGNTVHKAMEQRINSGTPLPEAMQKWEKFCTFGPKMTVRAEVKLGIRADGTPCGFFADDVWMRGVIDVLASAADVPRAVVLMDHKTGKVREDGDELECHAVLLKASRPELEHITGWYNWLAEGTIGKAHDLSGTEAKLADIRTTRRMIEHFFPFGEPAFRPRQNPLCGWCPVKSCEFNTSEGRQA